MKEFTKEYVAKIVETVSEANKSGKLLWSRNKKLNTCLQTIAESLFEICEAPEDSYSTIKRYMRDFPKELDYNIAQYANLLAYYYDIREFYKNCGYSVKGVERCSNTKIWNLYMRQVGYVARELVTRNF